jgi:hypothetical protein
MLSEAKHLWLSAPSSRNKSEILRVAQNDDRRRSDGIPAVPFKVDGCPSRRSFQPDAAAQRPYRFMLTLATQTKLTRFLAACYP